jgi:hypothetical protein
MKNGPRHAVNNHANQLNPNNAAYWQSRGQSAPPAAPAAVPAPLQHPQGQASQGQDQK